MRIILILGLLYLVGCERCEWTVDQKARTEMFFKCMKAIPQGPTHVKYNDWDEVVSECNSVAYSLTKKWECKK